MKKLLVVGVIVIFLSVSVIPSTGTIDVKKISMPTSSGNILYVGGNGTGNYTKIQDAINDSSNGDTVFVYNDSSPYYEKLIVNKSIKLIGEGKNSTIIDGEEEGHVIQIYANGIEISYFTIQNAGISMVVKAGIYIRSNYNFNKIYNNIFINNTYGAYIDNSLNNRIFNNTFKNNFDGIALGYSNNNTISNNTIINNQWNGIFLKSSFNNIISMNRIMYNAAKGIYLTQSNDNKILENDIFNNDGGGITLFWKSNKNSLSKNILKNNLKFDGITIGKSFDNNISRNIIMENIEHGIRLWDSKNNTIYRNEIVKNQIGIILKNSTDNWVMS